MKIENQTPATVFPNTGMNQLISELQNIIISAGLTPNDITSLTGTSSSSGTTITGVGSLFLTEVKVGDLLYKDSAEGYSRRVTSIPNDLSLTVESAFDSEFSGVVCSIFDVTQVLQAVSLLVSVPDATTSVKGIGKTSTRALIEAGTDETTFNTPKALRDAMASSKATNGYTKLPNGIIMQWGTNSIAGNVTTNITLPISFPNAFLNATCSYQSTDIGLTSACACTKPSLSQIGLTNGIATTEDIAWYVIGH